MTLIDQSERFVFKPLLYELVNGAASPEEVAPPFVQLLAPYSVNFVQVLACVDLQTHSGASPGYGVAFQSLPWQLGAASALVVTLFAPASLTSTALCTCGDGVRASVLSAGQRECR